MYNRNSGYGQLTAIDTHAGRFGKVIVVGKNGLAKLQSLKEIFGNDVEGKLRFTSTVAAAVAQCEASAGDRIVLMPGHTETVSSATGMSMSVAGVRVIGLGEGTLIPTVTLDTAATTTIAVSASDVSFENVAFSANYADITSLFTLTTAKNLKLKNCKFKATAANMNFLAIVKTSTTDNAADGVTFEGCSWIEPDAATLYLVSGLGDIDGLTVKGCYLNLGVNTNDLPALVNMATGKDATNLVIEDNKVIRLNDANPLLIVADTTTANTGIVKGNFVRHADTSGELLATVGTNIGFFDNKASAVADFSGFLLPAADS